MNATNAPLVLSLRALQKDRAQGRAEAYSLRVPRLDVALGEKLLITGSSGSGKSTVLDMIGMVLKPDRADRFMFCPDARAFYDRQASTPVQEDVSARKDASGPGGRDRFFDIAAAWARNDVELLAGWRRTVGYVLQTGGLLPFISVLDNIRTPRRLLGFADVSAQGRGASETGASETDMGHLAELLGITHLLRKLPAQLSVGERQRVAIARALAADPPLVLADEPTAALDPHNAAGVLALFSRIVEEMGTTLILVSHAPEQLDGMGFRTLQVRAVEEADAQGVVMSLCDSLPSDASRTDETGGGNPCAS